MPKLLIKIEVCLLRRHQPIRIQCDQSLGIAPRVRVYSAALDSSGASAAVPAASSLAPSVWPAPAVSLSEEVQRVCLDVSTKSHARYITQGTTYEVVTQELHDERRVLVALLAKGVKFCKTSG